MGAGGAVRPLHRRSAVHVTAFVVTDETCLNRGIKNKGSPVSLLLGEALMAAFRFTFTCTLFPLGEKGWNPRTDYSVIPWKDELLQRLLCGLGGFAAEFTCTRRKKKSVLCCFSFSIYCVGLKISDTLNENVK